MHIVQPRDPYVYSCGPTMQVDCLLTTICMIDDAVRLPFFEVRYPVDSGNIELIEVCWQYWISFTNEVRTWGVIGSNTV